MTVLHAGHDHPPRPWTPVFFLFLALIPLYWYLSKGHWPTFFEREERTVTLGPGVTDWYMTVKLPEAPSDITGMQVYKEKLASWLAALTREGFRPMLLSDIQDRISHSEGLPEKSVVLVFEPGLVTTYHVAAPLLRWYKTPAVWITNEAAVKRRDRKYVSTFKLWQMKRSGMWDIGSYEGPNVLKIKTHGSSAIRFGTETKAVWKTSSVSTAMNRAKSLVNLNRLKVSQNWSDRELISRLYHEIPAQGTCVLTLREELGRAWGIAVPGVSYTNALFNLRTPLDKRAGSLSWPGTKGISDFDLQMDVNSVVGELWLFVRSERATGSAIRIGFLPGMLLVETSHEKVRERILEIPIRSLAGEHPFTTTISARGTRLSIKLNGKGVADADILSRTASNEEMLEMVIYNRIRGTASADGIRMIYTPVYSPK